MQLFDFFLKLLVYWVLSSLCYVCKIFHFIDIQIIELVFTDLLYLHGFWI